MLPAMLDLPDRTRAVVARLEATRGFPAVGAHIAEINRLVAEPSTSASRLANAVCRDFALTTRLLRLVNSAWYRQVREPVATVSRAVVLLGFERVRAIAANLILFDHLQTGPGRTALADHALSALTASLVARALSGDADGVEAGEAALAAMFHRLGDALVALLPDLGDAIDATPGEREAAEVEVLGVTAGALGQIVARRWGFPDLLVDAMPPLPPGPVWPPHDRASWLRVVGGFGHAVAEGLVDEAAMGGLLGRFGEALNLDAPRLERLLRTIGREVVSHAEVLEAAAGPAGGKAARLLQRLGAVPLPPADGGDPGPDLERGQRAFLAQGLDEVTRAVAAGDDLNLVLAAVVETVYRGLGFDRVVLCVHEVDSRTMRARHGFGRDVDALLTRFAFPVARADDLFARAALDGEDVVHEAPTTPGAQRRLPAWYRPLAGGAFVAYPMRLNGVPVGLLYADTHGPLPRGRLIHLKRLRDLAVSALDVRRRGRAAKGA